MHLIFIFREISRSETNANFTPELINSSLIRARPTQKMYIHVFILIRNVATFDLNNYKIGDFCVHDSSFSEWQFTSCSDSCRLGLWAPRHRLGDRARRWWNQNSACSKATIRGCEQVCPVFTYIHGRGTWRSDTGGPGSVLSPHYMLDTNMCIYLIKYQPEIARYRF